jgi:hypothetical protein
MVMYHLTRYLKIKLIYLLHRTHFEANQIPPKLLRFPSFLPSTQYLFVRDWIAPLHNVRMCYTVSRWIIIIEVRPLGGGRTDHVISEAVSQRLSTRASQIRSQVRLCVGQSDAGPITGPRHELSSPAQNWNRWLKSHCACVVLFVQVVADPPSKESYRLVKFRGTEKATTT